MSDPKPCAHCEREFSPNASHHIYCCEACAAAARRVRKNIGGFRPKKCKHCGVEFTPTNGAQRYCTPECRWEGSFVEAECAGCGKTFRWNKQWGYRKVCSKSCAARLVERKPPALRTCEHCGKHFESAPSRPRVFCSPECFYAGRAKAGAKKKPARYNQAKWSLKAKGEERCRRCGMRADHLHHIVPRSHSREGKEDVANNGMPLCSKCHRGWHARSIVIERSCLRENEVANAARLMGEGWVEKNYPWPADTELRMVYAAAHGDDP